MSFDDLSTDLATERPKDRRHHADSAKVETVASRHGRAPTWPRRLRDSQERGDAAAEAEAVREMIADNAQATVVETVRLAEIDRLHAIALSAQLEGGDAHGRF